MVRGTNLRSLGHLNARQELFVTRLFTKPTLIETYVVLYHSKFQGRQSPFS